MTHRLRPAGILLACAILCACSESLPPVPPMEEPLTAADLPGTVETNGCKAMREVVEELHQSAQAWHNPEAIRGLIESHADQVPGWLDRLDAAARTESWECGGELRWLALLPEAQDLSSAVALVFENASEASRRGDVETASHRAATILLLAVRGSGGSILEARSASRHVHAGLSVLGRLNVSEIAPATRAELTEALGLLNSSEPFNCAVRLASERDTTLEALQNGWISRADREQHPSFPALTREQELNIVDAYRDAMDTIIQAWTEPDGIERISATSDGFEPTGFIWPYHEILREMRALGMRMQSTQRRLDAVSGG
ncbi:MAG: hypothetical protein AAFX05_07665 [Planctomycetota bacterium]